MSKKMFQHQVSRSEILAAIISLVVVSLVLGWLGIQFNSVPLWMAPAFSGWAAPVAAEFSEGMVLYTDGGHLPMSPLPFVLVYLISHGEPLWVHGQVLSQLFMALTAITLFLGTVRVFGRPAAFLASMLILLVLFSKTGFLLYNYMALFFASVCMALVANLATSEPIHEQSLRSYIFSTSSRQAFLLGIAAVTCMLSKQSIGIGAFLGCGTVLLFFPRGFRLRHRMLTIAMYLFGSALAFAGWCVLLSSFIDSSGMLVDVFLKGSETKGGLSGSIYRLGTYVMALGHWLPVFYPNGSDFRAHLYALPAALLLFLLWIDGHAKPSDQAVSNNNHRHIPEVLMFGSAITIIVLIFVFGQMGVLKFPEELIGTIPGETQRYHLTGLMFWFLNLYLLVSLFPAVRARITNAMSIDNSVLLALILFAYPTFVVGHLSMPRGQLYFHYFGLHLAFIGTGLVLMTLIAFCSRLHATGFRFAAHASVWAVVVVTAVFLYMPKYTRFLNADQTWANIRTLKNVAMPAQHQNYLSVVRLVRQLAPKTNDEVLMLPNAPLFESFLERQRPQLSSAIVFMDTYPDRYVDNDFSRLRDNLPKVIVIGPRPEIYRIVFRRELFWGTERLIRRIDKELLPDYYQLAETFNVRQGHVKSSISVYERLGPATLPLRD